jgi:hypothetical protein
MLVKIIFRISILAVCILVSTACRTADGPQFDPLESYNGSDSLVFIYRPTPSYAYGGGLAPDILIDGNKIIDLKSMGYTRVFLKPGSHSLTLKRAHAYKSRRESEYAFTIPENTKRCFIRIALPHSIGQDLAALTINTTFGLATKIYVPLIAETDNKSGSGFVMDFIDEKNALEEIKNCRYLYPELDSL